MFNRQGIYMSNRKTRTNTNPYYYLGKNPTVDFVALKKENDDIKVLLILRGREPEKDKWALPGGFQDTNAPIDGFWFEGKETPLDAVIRELNEETGFNVNDLVSNELLKIIFVGEYEGNQRDPRDNSLSWSCSKSFLADFTNVNSFDLNKIDSIDKEETIKGEWFSIKEIESLSMAFDHKKILQDALNIFFKNENRQNCKIV